MARKTDGKSVSIRGGNKRKVQARKERKDGFTAAKKRIVLDHIATCCNLKAAAEAAGITPETVNYHRRRDPVFAGQFDEALEIGYGNLEAQMIALAAGGWPDGPGPDSPEPAPEPLPPDRELGLHLLRLRRKAGEKRTGRAGYAPRRVSEKALDESLLAKLEVLNRRLRLKREQVRKLKTRGDVAAAAGMDGGEGE